jgi:hypothetical protein
MHLYLIQDIWAENVHCKGTVLGRPPVSDATVDRLRGYFQRNPQKYRAKRVLCCSYQKQPTPKSLVSAYFETEQTSTGPGPETRRLRRAIQILQRFWRGLQNEDLLAHDSRARRTYTRNECVLCHFKGDGLWSCLFYWKSLSLVTLT